MATRANVKTVVLSHFLPAIDPKDEYERLGEQVNKHFSLARFWSPKTLWNFDAFLRTSSFGPFAICRKNHIDF
jgi:ribonuclease BN (tRNA processing enzyme)